jgi:acyl carrier protein
MPDSDRQALLRELARWGVALPYDKADDTPLITSGVLDSLNLVELAAWVEQQVGRPIDATAIDLTEEWNTPASILRFVQQHRSVRRQ